MAFTPAWQFIVRRLRRDDGQDLLEYALLASLIAIAAVGAVTQVGTTITSVFWSAISAGGPSVPAP
jgi:Flp pilus assembly pilin Flp